MGAFIGHTCSCRAAVDQNVRKGNEDTALYRSTGTVLVELGFVLQSPYFLDFLKSGCVIAVSQRMDVYEQNFA